jgi:hypothetical protein
MNDCDPIVAEVRRIRDAHAAKFNYDPDAIFRDIKEQEKRSGRKYISFADDPIAPIQPQQPTGAAPSVAQDSQSLEAAPVEWRGGSGPLRPVGVKDGGSKNAQARH